MLGHNTDTYYLSVEVLLNYPIKMLTLNILLNYYVFVVSSVNTEVWGLFHIVTVGAGALSMLCSMLCLGVVAPDCIQA